MPTFLKPVDRLTIFFLALFSAVALLFISAIPHWGWLVVRYGMLMLAVVALAYYHGRSNTWKLALYLYAFLPVLIIPVVFDSLGDLIPWLRPRLMDGALIRIDYAMFGVHPTVWMEGLVHPALTTAMQLAYISYYPMSAVLGLVLFLKNRNDEFDEAVFGIILCFYLSYVGYILFPAIGPRFTLADLQTTDIQAIPLVTAIRNTLNGLEHNKADAFPSGHTAVALMTLYYAWKTRERMLFFILVPVITALIFSTVYLRYHYVIDVIGGILLTALTIPLAPGVRRIMSGSTKPPGKQLHRAP